MHMEAWIILTRNHVILIVSELKIFFLHRVSVNWVFLHISMCVCMSLSFASLSSLCVCTAPLSLSGKEPNIAKEIKKKLAASGRGNHKPPFSLCTCMYFSLFSEELLSDTAISAPCKPRRRWALLRVSRRYRTKPHVSPLKWYTTLFKTD